jgi:hypothetical protein
MSASTGSGHYGDYSITVGAGKQRRRYFEATRFDLDQNQSANRSSHVATRSAI